MKEEVKEDLMFAEKHLAPLLKEALGIFAKDQRYCHCAGDAIIQGDLSITNTYLNCIALMWLMADIETVTKELGNLEGEEIGCRSMEMLCMDSSLGDFC